LTALLERAGGAVTRDELKKQLWAGDTFGDLDHGLNAAINKIREALNDSADQPRFIETLPNGYRFIGELQPGVPLTTAATNAAEPLTSVPPPDLLRTHARTLRYAVIGIVTAAVIVVSLFAVRYQRAVFSQPKFSVKSIAVLPLRNLSGDASQEYLSDSLTDELITQLAKRSTLRVVSAASVMRFKNTNASIPEIGRDLKVDAFVEGSVLRSGENVRITAQLIDAASDRHIWAEDYHGEVRDIMVLQNNIAAAIVNKVQAGIAPSEVMKLPPPHRIDPRAYDAYTRGRAYWSRGKLLVHGPDDLEKSAEQFRLAIKYDPNYAPAYAGLANYYGIAAGTGQITPKDGWKLCEDAAQKALALDPSSAEAHLALATKLVFYDWDWAGGERELQVSVASDPRYPEVHNALSHFYAYMERFDESIAEARRAGELDPIGQSAALQRAFGFSRRYDLFLEEVQRTFSQDLVRVHESRALVHAARKQYAQEVKESDQALRIQGRSAEADRYARGYARGGYRGWLEAKLAEMKKDAGEGYIDNFEFAQIYTALDNSDMAMHYLEAAYRDHLYTLARLQLVPAFDPLHSDPRYQDLIRRIGLPQQSPMTQ
ncbi:MAG TPA: winged helix-turn-helix domain-containing protein, partial [Candidatus Acidoferrum sp.]|jgi:TolB-like protein